MDERLRNHIGEIYDGGAWEAVTGVLWKYNIPFQLWKFEQDVEFEGKLWRCLIIQDCTYDTDDLTAVDCARDVFAEAWGLRDV